MLGFKVYNQIRDIIWNEVSYWHCVFNVYNVIMKQKDLIKKLKELGYSFVRHGGNHDVYSNGVKSEMLPRHKEIDEDLAKSILRRCEK